MFDSARLGASWIGGTPQPGYFPFRVGAIICVASATIVLRAILRARSGGPPFAPWERFRRVLAVLGPTLGYIAGIHLVGIYVASGLFVAGFMRVAGRYGWLKCLLVGGITGAVLFWLFEVRFLVPLPKGPLERWLGY
jgi:putative tricarboxylic transport membrane protein